MRTDSRHRGAAGQRAFLGDALWVSCSAYILALANFQPRYAALAWIGLMPLIRIVRLRVDSYSGFFAGLWGFAFFSLYTLTHPIASFEHSLILIAGGTLGLGLIVGFYSLVARRFGFNPLLFGILWILFEWGRSAAGFSGGVLALSQPNPSAYGTLISVFGLLGISMLIVLANAFLDSLWDWVGSETAGSPSLSLNTTVSVIFHRYCYCFITPYYSTPQLRGPPLNHTPKLSI